MLRAVLLAVLTVSAVACVPRVEPAGPPNGEARLVDGGLVAADGARLPLRRWLPKGRPSAVVLALHGFNDYSRAFDRPAAFWAERGIATYAYDQRGFGDAPHRGIWAGSETMVEDLRTMARLARRAHPDTPLFLMGVSMGAAVVLVATTGRNPVAADGAILIAPAVWGRRHMKLIPRVALWFFSRTMPWLTLTGNDLNVQASDNIAMLKELGRDPLVIKETRVDAIHGLVDLMDEAFTASLNISERTLILYGRKDEIIPKQPMVEMLLDLPKHQLVKMAVYEKGYHMLLRDLGAETVLTDIAAWIADPKAPLPSGADVEAGKLADAQ